MSGRLCFSAFAGRYPIVCLCGKSGAEYIRSLGNQCARPRLSVGSRQLFSTAPGSGIEQGEQTFSFSVSVDGTTIPLHLSFPALGGFRLYSDQTGYFEAEEYRDIQYTQGEAGQIAMTAGDDATVVYSQTENTFALDVYNEADVRLFRITPEQIGFAYSRGDWPRSGWKCLWRRMRRSTGQASVSTNWIRWGAGY